MVFCFGIRLAPYAVFFFFFFLFFFHSDLPSTHCTLPVESGRPINTVFVRPFFRSKFIYVQF